MPEKYIIVTGNLSDGFDFVGPFDSFEDATIYCEENGGEWYGDWVASLEAPIKQTTEKEKV